MGFLVYICGVRGYIYICVVYVYKYVRACADNDDGDTLSME